MLSEKEPKRVKVKCQNCGKEFVTIEDWDWRYGKPRFFCSEECYFKSIGYSQGSSQESTVKD